MSTQHEIPEGSGFPARLDDDYVPFHRRGGRKLHPCPFCGFLTEEMYSCGCGGSAPKRERHDPR